MATHLTTTTQTSLVTTDDETQTPVPATTNYLAVIIVGSILLVAHLPMLFLLSKDLWSREHYQFFVFIPFAAAFLMWEGIGRLKGPVQAGNQIICYVLILISALMLVVSSLITSGTLAAVSALLTLATIIYGIGGWTLFKELLPGWVIFFLAVPPPFRIDDLLITTLQRWVAMGNGKILDVIGVEHLIQGTTVKLPGRQLMVEEACSGIHSLFSSLFVALLLSLYNRRGVIHTLLLMFITVYWVLVGNLARVLAIVIADVKFGYSGLAEGLPHSMLSIMIFLFIIPLILSTDRLLLFMSPWSKRSLYVAPSKEKPWHTSILELVPDLNQSWLSSWAVGLLFALIACLQFWIVGRDTLTLTRPNIEIAEIGVNGLPDKLLGSTRLGYEKEDRTFNHINGEHSQMWSYAFNNKYKGNVSLDYTFTGWHELTICYVNNGWTVTNKTIDGTVEEGKIKDPYLRVEMVMPHTGQHGYLLFCMFDENGKRIDPPKGREEKLFRQRLDNIYAKITGKEIAGGMTIPTYQVQLFIPTYGELTEAEKTLAAQFYRDIEGRIQGLVAKYKKASPGANGEEPTQTDSTNILGVRP
ncbi:exosortase U [bacterium]|nr:exosortase U [bacterium]